MVSLAPELSLATIGGSIPVIEVPPGVQTATLEETAWVMMQIGLMVGTSAKNTVPPKHTMESLGSKDNTIPNIYWRGQEAMK